MRNILAALLTVALCLGLAACGPAPEPEPTPTPTPSVSPSPEAAEFALACYPEAGFHPITGSNRTNLDEIPQIDTNWDEMMQVADDTAAKLNELCQ